MGPLLLGDSHNRGAIGSDRQLRGRPPGCRIPVTRILPFSFAVGAITAGRGRGHNAAGYLISFFIYFGVLGMQTIGRSLPFGLTLGASRRSFYSGTALLGMALALVSGLALTALQAIERATGEPVWLRPRSRSR
jgi:hypothetical protein